MNDSTIEIGIFGTTNYIFPNKSTTDLSALYDALVAEFLVDPVEKTNTSGYDDGARSFTLDQKGWNCIADYTGEGSFGLTFSNLPKRNSGFSFSRMYYTNNIEPDYQIICGFNKDGYFNSIKLKYDENKLIVYMNLRNLDNAHAWAFLAIIDKSNNYNLDEIYVRNTANWTDSTSFYVGYKNYNRNNTSWRPISFNVGLSLFNSTTSIKSINFVGETTYHQTSNKEVFVYKDNNSLNREIKEEYNIAYTLDNNYEYEFENNDTFNYNYFIEGMEFKEDNHIKIYDVFNNKTTYYKMNNLIESLYFADYKNMIISYNGITKHVNKYSKNMIRGEIFGNINLKSCGDTNYNDLEVRCYRSDNVFIGTYPVNKNGQYNIPNLDYNDYYDIILIDKSKTIEWKVHSQRKPSLYSNDLPVEYEVKEIIGHQINKDIDSFKIRIYLDQLETTKYDKIIMYFSNEEINDQNIIYLVPYTITGNSYNTDTIYKYYNFRVYYKDKFSSYYFMNDGEDYNLNLNILEGDFINE